MERAVREKQLVPRSNTQLCCVHGREAYFQVGRGETWTEKEQGEESLRLQAPAATSVLHGGRQLTINDFATE